MIRRIAVAAIVALFGIGISGCSHGVNALPPTSHTLAQQPSGPRAAGALDDSDGCPEGSYSDGDGGCLQDIGGTTTTCGYTCSSDQSPCVADPGLCTVTVPVNGGGGGGGGDVATTTPEAGLNCDNSPIALGTSNLPGGTNGWGTTVVNIFGLQDTNATTYGWIYQNAHQQLFFQRNAADTIAQVDFLKGDLENIPGVAGIIQALVDATTSPYQLTATQANNIEASWDQQPGQNVHHCFSGPLPAPIG